MPQPPDGLTQAECTCLLLTAEGRSICQIAHAIDAHEQAVQAHLDSARQKLAATSNLQAIARALKLGLIG
ncbi:LuxR C-terminal-related transcriptional regulator [Hoeflea olei]|uniref:HTH luxR-type domain-containing protein n=1 Tax=Hoeflea olei TaxID=1480615 RepID=A0A1C1Z0U8_9HYPH|nr:LuxR C-terminal-related transcriptional regulator [Hoeflea olei]OCW59319.1 hypothetical protein AWJ14_09750 [Hoeflea olei]